MHKRQIKDIYIRLDFSKSFNLFLAADIASPHSLEAGSYYNENKKQEQNIISNALLFNYLFIYLFKESKGTIIY